MNLTKYLNMSKTIMSGSLNTTEDAHILNTLLCPKLLSSDNKVNISKSSSVHTFSPTVVKMLLAVWFLLLRISSKKKKKQKEVLKVFCWRCFWLSSSIKAEKDFKTNSIEWMGIIFHWKPARNNSFLESFGHHTHNSNHCVCNIICDYYESNIHNLKS